MTMRNYKVLCVGTIAAGIIILFFAHSPKVHEFVLGLGAQLKEEPLGNLNKWIEAVRRLPIAVMLFLYSYLLASYPSSQTTAVYVPSPPKEFMGLAQFLEDFILYVKRNLILLALAFVVAFVVHGIKLGEQVIGIDTEVWLKDKTVNWIEIGRFSLVLLQKLTTFMGQNLFFINLFTILFLSLGAMAWCHLFCIMSGWKGGLPYTAFVLIYCSSPIWIEHLHFTLQSLEITLAMVFIPCCIYSFFSALVEKRGRGVILGILALSFIIGIYQSFVVVFCCGLLICYLFFGMSGKVSKEEYVTMILKGICCVIAALVVYFLVNKIIHYLAGMTAGAGGGYLESMANFSSKFIALSIPIYCARLFANSMTEFCILLLFLPLYFLQRLPTTPLRCLMRGILALIVVMLFAFPLVTGGRISLRAQLMEPVVMGFAAFMVFARFGGGRRIAQRVFKGMFLVLCVLQIQDSSLVNYTDYLRYQQDKMLAHDIHRELQRLECGDAPVILYGNYAPRYFESHKISEVSGHSFFEWDKGARPSDSTSRGLAFMRALGFYYHTTQDEALIQKARLAAESMVDYPSPGFAQNLGDVVVVRLSESSYVSE